MKKPLPLTAIRTFEIAASRLSFKITAEELGVTPTAVSHQIRHLEDLCGTKLFQRGSKGVKLTSQGRKFAEEVHPAIEQLEMAYKALTRSASRDSLVLGAGPIIASRWLAPRLSAFAAQHPDIDLQLLNSPTEIWQRAAEFDIAIAWGEGNWPGLDAEKLLDVRLSPVLTPKLAQEIGPLTSPSDILRAPLLHHRDQTEWTSWLHKAGEEAQVPTGTYFEDSNVLVQAALSGSGVMLGVVDFLSDDISAGRLIKPFGIELAPKSAYYLTSPTGTTATRFSELGKWLRAQVHEQK